MGCVIEMAEKKELVIPEFSSDEEEREFWETHDIRDYDDGPADIVWDIREETKKRVTLRLQPSLIDELKEFAAEVDLPYQTLTRALIRRGLEQARRERAERRTAVEAGRRE
jgi:predicted DNA binding CopG/RHH family protein